MRSKLPYILPILVIALLAGCSKDDDPAGPAGAVSKPFNLAVAGLESTIAYNILVSPDGTKLLAGITNEVNPEFHYSKDGGATFTQVGDGLNRNLRYASEISDNGIVLTSQNQVYQMEGGAQVSISGGETVVLGDKGKVFVYHHNTATLSFKNINESAFQPIEKPIVATPGSAASYYAIRARGKGVVFVSSPINRSDKTISAYLLDEATMTWTSHSAPLIYSNINGCNNLVQFERYLHGANNNLIVKGCTGMALMDLTAGTTKYVTYPTITDVIPESFRDGMTFMDKQGVMYVAARAYTENFSRLYQFKDNKWGALPDNMVGYAVLAVDVNGNLFYNSSKAEGRVVKSPVKVAAQSGVKTLLGLPREKEQVLDAVGVGDEVMLVSNGQLFRYDVASGEVTTTGLTNISHFNILSDGRWIAGGGDFIHISNDDGQTWTKTDKLFSPSLTQFQMGMMVTDTRLVNGQLLILGTSTYTYNNLSLGIAQTKHDNMLVSLTGGKQNYQFPVDMSDGVIAPDGTLYGSAMFVSEFGSINDFYEIKAGESPKRLTIKQGPTPHIITDEGLQITLRGALQGSGVEVSTRSNVEEEWKSVSDVLPNTSAIQGIMKLRAGGEGITFINGPEVYVSAN